MRPKSSLIFSFLMILMPGYSSFSQTHAELISGKPESAESEAIEQQNELFLAPPLLEEKDTSIFEQTGSAESETIEQEELFLAPPLPKEQDDWTKTTVPEFSNQQNKQRPSLSPPPTPSKWNPVTTPPIQPQSHSTPESIQELKSSDWIDPTTPKSVQSLTPPASNLSPNSAQSPWFKLTPPKDSHWRNQLSFPSQPGPPTSPSHNRQGKRKQKAKGKGTPWAVTPMVEPADRLYIEKSRVKSQTKVHLDETQLQTILVDEKIHHRIIGQLYNHTPGYVYNLRVHYRIQQGLQTVDVGEFSVGKAQPLAPGDRIRFAYPVPITGELKISFVEWKYADGSQGIAGML